MTRRSFTLGMAAAARVSAAAARKLDIGIGTFSYHNLSIDDMIVQLKALRIAKIEMSRGEFMLLSHPKDELFRSARTKFDAAGIRCLSYYSATIHDDGELADAIRFATLLGARYITGDATGGDLLKHIDAQCTRAGLTFGIHNHFFPGEKFAYETASDVLRALAPLSPTCGATLDVGQMASCGHDTVDAVHRLAPRLKMVHLKDVKAAGGEVNVLIGQGIAKIPEVMAALRDMRFPGLVAIEYEKDGPVEDDMRREVEYARSLA